MSHRLEKPITLKMTLGSIAQWLKSHLPPGLIKAKAALFLIVAVSSLAVEISRHANPTDLFLIGVALWSTARLYYFAFYVIERWLDPNYRYDGIVSAVRWILTRPDESKERSTL